VNLYPNPTAPLIPLYPNSPVGENRSLQNLTCGPSTTCISASSAAMRNALVSTPGYCDQKVANREIRVWHFVIKNGY
jgi:hypothetical protein